MIKTNLFNMIYNLLWFLLNQVLSKILQNLILNIFFVGTNNPENLVREPMPQHNDEDQQETVQSNNQSPKLSVVNSQLLITSDHRYGLEFVGKLADHQRRQYESEMTRVTSSRYDTDFILKFFHIFILYKKINNVWLSASSMSKTEYNG